MKFRIDKSFDRDLRNITNKRLLKRLKGLISVVGDVTTIQEIPKAKKIEGYKSYYRIKTGDYRVGVEVSSGEVIFLRFLHRKDIYRYFPNR